MKHLSKHIEEQHLDDDKTINKYNTAKLASHIESTGTGDASRASRDETYN